jgi:glyoxylase-like metal-dependent hydrolase (beta-lactamase superfamily II)
LAYRRQNPRLFLFLEKPYVTITPHLLRNRTSTVNAYVLLSESGKALVIDFGYDFMVGTAAGTDRASRRPWLYTLSALKRDYGVQTIDVAIPTHHHDDHVAGLNLLREVEGTQVWAAENFADILERPARYDLPCLWYDPIAVDRILALNTPIVWEEYEMTLYELPGHTLYAVAIVFTVDGKRVLVTGDQYQGNEGILWNYVYQSHFRIGDYRVSAELYRRLMPDLILSGHWEPLWVQSSYLDVLQERGEALERLHRQLLPLETINLGAEGFAAWIHPYQVMLRSGNSVELEVEIHNPFPRREEAVVRIVAPEKWTTEEDEVHVWLEAGGVSTVKVRLTPPAGLTVRRARVAADLTVGSQHFGQQAEALVTVY